MASIKLADKSAVPAATVSHAWNNTAKVTPEVRQRVLRAEADKIVGRFPMGSNGGR